MKDTIVWLAIFEAIGKLPASKRLTAYEIYERTDKIYEKLMQKKK